METYFLLSDATGGPKIMTVFQEPRTRAGLICFFFLLLEFFLITWVDQPLSTYIRTLNPRMVDVFRAYTRFGKSDIYLLPSGLGALLCLALARWGHFSKATRQKIQKGSNALIFFFLCVAMSGLIDDAIKPLLGRARPVLLERQSLYAFVPFTFHDANFQSMPSGHATTAFAIAGALTALWPRARIPFFIFALAIGLSRIMVNAHYLSDVLAGAILGLLTVEAILFLCRRRGWPLGLPL
jgi:undecaprenyl-diphosphatase